MSNTKNESRRRRAPAARPVVSRAQRMRRRWAKQIRDAAEMILDGKKQLACNALSSCMTNPRAWRPVQQLFKELFRPSCAWIYWWDPGDVEPRVTALLLLAEIVEESTDEQWAELCGPMALTFRKGGAR